MIEFNIQPLIMLCTITYAIMSICDISKYTITPKMERYLIKLYVLKFKKY